MKTLVVYKSKSGYAKTYAEWIAKDLECDIKENTGLSLNDLEPYDVIIYGGGVYVGKIAGIKLIKNNYEALKNKKLIVWASGADPGNEKTLSEFWKNNFDEQQLQNIKLFYLRGGFDYRKLGPVDKLLMNVFRKALAKEKNPSEDTKGFLDAFYTPQNYCKQENALPLIDYVRSLSE